ncbi:Protein of unknown function [Gryllus bimaculatus]|nr:Protein of unknown function [Gryllus bimaculatus]
MVLVHNGLDQRDEKKKRERRDKAPPIGLASAARRGGIIGEGARATRQRRAFAMFSQLRRSFGGC